MYFQKNIDTAIEHQRRVLAEKYRKAIADIDKRKENKNKLYMYLARNYVQNQHKTRGWDSLLSIFCIFNEEYELAWMLVYYLNIMSGNPASCIDYPAFMKRELEGDLPLEKQPFKLLMNGDEVEYFNKSYIEKNILKSVYETHPSNVHVLPRFVPDNENYNRWYIGKQLEGNRSYGDPTNISPDARYDPVGDTKQGHISYSAFDRSLLLLESYFRLEQYAEADECLYRMKVIVASGDPPKYLTEGPRARHLAPLVNMYDCWFKARFSENPEHRLSHAWEALFWNIELGLRLTGTSFLNEYFSFTDFCEIVGEFELLGDRQEEFLGHFKHYAAHSSVSVFEKMRKNPIQPIRFAERNTPTYDEFKSIYGPIKENYIAKHR